jgi:hypothetical protein|tara:strand:+ start:244 stop:957 length:714 start_codon:yes stop_codon:yes gene_type:complete
MADVGEGISTLYDKIPTNMRLLLEFIGNKKTPITEKDFTQDELLEIRQRIMEQEGLNEKSLNEIKTAYESLSSRDDFSQGFGVLEMDPETGQMMETQSAAEAREKTLQSMRDRINSYTETQDKVSVFPSKGQAENRPMFYETDRKPSGYLKTIKDSFTSPEKNIDTTLHNFNAVKNADNSYTVTDDYNWNMPEGERPGISSLLSTAATDPEGFLNAIMRMTLPQRSRQVEINLPERR